MGTICRPIAYASSGLNVRQARILDLLHSPLLLVWRTAALLAERPYGFDCVEDGYITAPASPLGGTPHHRHQHPRTDLTSTATLHTITPSVSETKSTMLPSVIVLTIALAASTANAACVPWKDGGTLQVCKSAGKRNCLGASSDSTCINLIGGPFISGFSGGGYTCRIYSGSGCSGRYASVDRDGWSRFPFTARSFRCPCV